MQKRLNHFFGNLIYGATPMFSEDNHSFSVKFNHYGLKYILSYGCKITKDKKENSYFFFCNFRRDGLYNKEKYSGLARLVGSGQSGKKNLFHTCGKDNGGLEHFLFECSDYIAGFAEKMQTVHMRHRIYESLSEIIFFPPTKVIFRKTKEDDIVAFFPEEKYDDGDAYMSYMHIGQHGAATKEFYLETKAATEKEYISLKTELETHHGYYLDVRKKWM